MSSVNVSASRLRALLSYIIDLEANRLNKTIDNFHADRARVSRLGWWAALKERQTINAAHDLFLEQHRKRARDVQRLIELCQIAGLGVDVTVTHEHAWIFNYRTENGG